MAAPSPARPVRPTGVPVPRPTPRPAPLPMLVNEVRVPLSSQQQQPPPQPQQATTPPRPTPQAPTPQPAAAPAYAPQAMATTTPRPTYRRSPAGPDPRNYTSPTLRAHTAGQARALDQGESEAMRAQAAAIRDQQALESAAAKSMASQAKAEADRAKRDANNQREAAFRAQGRPMYVDADGIIQPTHDDATWQEMQAAKTAKAAAEKKAAETADRYTLEGRKFITSKVTGQPIPLQTDEDLAKAAQARQEKARRANYDKQLAALDATAADPKRKPLTETARSKATEQLTETETAVRAALAARLKKAGQEVTGGNDFIPFNENPTAAAQQAQQKAAALMSGGEIADADLADLESDPATAPMVAKYRNLRDALATDADNLTWTQSQAEKAYDIKLRRDNPEEWARQQATRRAGMDPAAIAADVETSAADFTTRAQDHSTRATALAEQQQAFAQKLDALEAKNAAARQRGIPAGDSVSFQREDGSTELWSRDLAMEREQLQAQAQEWQTQNQDAIDQLTAEGQDLAAEQTALIDAQKAGQEKAKTARADDLRKLAANPATRGLAQDLTALESEAETRQMVMADMYPDGAPPEAMDAMKKDLEEKQAAALQAHADRAQSVADAYTAYNAAVVDGPSGRFIPDGTYAKTAADLAAKIGVTPKEARTLLADAEKLDWTKSSIPDNLTNRFTGDLNEPTRVLHDGTIILNPSLVLGDESAAFKAIDTAKADPDIAGKVVPITSEMRAEAKAKLPAQRLEAAARMLPEFSRPGFFGGDFMTWREAQLAKGGEFAKQSPEEHLLSYLADLKNDSAAWKMARTFATSFVAGGGDIRSQASGILAMMTGSETLAQHSVAVAQEMQQGVLPSQYQGDNLGTRALGQAARILPGLGLTMGVGAVLQGAAKAALATRAGFTALTGLAKGVGGAKNLDQAITKVMTAAGLAGGAAGGFAQTAGSQYADIYGALRGRGMDHADAHRAALMPSVLAGTATAILTLGFGATGVEKILAPAAKDAAKKSFLGIMKSFFKGAVEELPEEVFDEAFSQVTAAVAKGDSVQKALDDFMLHLPELGLAIGLTGGGASALADMRSASSSPDQNPPGSLAAHQLPETVAAAQAAAAAFQPQEGSTLTAATLSAAIKVAQGQLSSMTTAELEQLGWTRTNGKLSPLKGYAGTPALEFADAAQTQPILRQEFVDAIDQQAPEVGAAIGMDEADIRAFYQSQNGPPAPEQQQQAPTQTPTTATDNGPQSPNIATAPESANPQQQGTVSNAAQATTQSPAATGNEAPQRPTDSGSPAYVSTLTKPADLERAEQLTNHLSMLGLPQDQAEQVADYMVSKNGAIGDSYLDQVVDKSFPATLKELGISGSLSAVKAKENPLKAPANLADRLAPQKATPTPQETAKPTQETPATPEPAAATAAETPTVAPENTSNQTPSSTTAPASLPPESHPLYTSLTRAEAYTPDEAQSLVARYLYLREKAGDTSKLDIKRFRQWIAEQETRARGGKLARAASTDEEPTLQESLDFSLTHIPLADRRRARRTFRSLQSALGKWSKAIDTVDMSSQARAELAGSIGLAMNITKDGKTVLLLDPTRLAQQVNWAALSTGIVQDAIVEEVIHATALRLSRTDKAFSTQAITAFWNDLSPKLRNTVWQSYHVIAIKNGKKPALPPTNLSNAERFQMVHEFLRMAVQNKRFQGRISETYGTNKKGVLKKILDLLAKLGEVLENLIATAPKELRGRIEDYRSKIIAAIDALENPAATTTTTTTTAAPPATTTATTATAAAQTVPETTRAAVTENATTTTATAAITDAPFGNVGTAYTDTNDSIEYRWTVVDASTPVVSNLDGGTVNPAYPQELQPRDRTSAGSEAQVQDIAKNMNLDRLSMSSTVADGAPFLGQDGAVESGNGRMMGMRRAYANGMPSAAAYRAKLVATAADYGLTAAQVSALKNPVLVRVRMTDVNRVAFAMAANVSTVAPKREMEQAKIDAKQIVPDLFNAFIASEEGDIYTKANAPFIRAFISAIVPPAEIPSMIDPDGNLSQTGLRRLRNALFVYAYGDSKPALEALARLTESIDADGKNIVAALTTLAPRFAAQNARIAAGVLRPLSVTTDIARALALYSDLKANGETVADFQQQMALPGVADAPTDLQKAIVGTLDATKRSARKLIDVLNRYADALETTGDPRQASLFGDEPPPTTLELWNLANTTPTAASPPLARSESTDENTSIPPENVVSYRDAESRLIQGLAGLLKIDATTAARLVPVQSERAANYAPPGRAIPDYYATRDNVQSLVAQEAQLIQRAQQEGWFWTADQVQSFIRNHKPLNGGGEHDVRLDPSRTLVIRATINDSFGLAGRSPAQYLRRIELFNAAFPSLQIRVIGASKNARGNAVLWTVQPFVVGKHFAEESQLQQALGKNGWRRIGSDTVYENIKTGLIMEDVHTGNVLTDGQHLYPIDVIVRPQTAALARSESTDEPAPAIEPRNALKLYRKLKQIQKEKGSLDPQQAQTLEKVERALGQTFFSFAATTTQAPASFALRSEEPNTEQTAAQPMESADQLSLFRSESDDTPDLFSYNNGLSLDDLLTPAQKQVKVEQAQQLDLFGNLDDLTVPDRIAPPLASSAATDESTLNETQIQSYFDLPEVNMAPEKRPPARRAIKALASASQLRFAQAAAFSALDTGDAAGVRTALDAQAAGKMRFSTLLHDFVTNDIPPFDIRGAVIESPADFAAFNLAVRSPFFESIKIAVLDNRRQVIHSQIVHVGALAETIAAPTSVARIIEAARRTNPKHKIAGFIIAHNHPSGNPAPSDADVRVTRKMEETGKLLGVPMIDHVITNGTTYFSFAQSGITNPNSSKFSATARPLLPTLPTPPRPAQSGMPPMDAAPPLAPWEAVASGSTTAFNNPAMAQPYLRTLRTADPDQHHILYLDTKGALRAVDRVDAQTETAELTRQIISRAVGEGSPQVMLALHYGTDETFPSASSVRLVRGLRETLGRAGLTLVDASITGTSPGSYYSFAESGALARSESTDSTDPLANEPQSATVPDGRRTLDPRSSAPTLITAARLSREQGQAARDVIAARLRSALREGPLNPAAPGYPAAIAAAYDVPVLSDDQYQAITALTDVGDGAEAAVHVDDDNGVVYKVLRTGKGGPSLGIWADVTTTSELELNWHFRPADRPRHLAARLAVMMDMGGTPTEIHAISPEGHVILKQPQSPDAKLEALNDYQDGRLAADQPRWREALTSANMASGMIRVPQGLLPQYNPAAYVVGVQGRPWLVLDTKPDNYIGDNQGAARINDPVIGQITASTVAQVPGLGSVVKAALQAEQQLGDRAQVLFSSASTSDANPLARLGWNHADRALSARTAAFTRWMNEKTGAGETVAKWTQSDNIKPFVAVGKVLQREFFPASVLPREITARMREMNIKSAMGGQRAMDMIRALSGKPKFSDMGYPPGFAENPIARRNLYMAMTGEKPMHELPQELQALAARLRSMLVQIGQESVRQGRMSLDTFEGLRENYMPHFYKDDADTAKNILKRFALGIKDILAQRTTAWHVVDTSVKGPDGQYRLVAYEGKKWRFKNKEHQAAWFEDFILSESLDALQGRDRKAYKALTVADLRAPAKLSPETRGRLTEIQANLRMRYRKEAPLTIAEQEKAGLIMDPVYAIARYAAQMVHDNATAEFFNFVNSNTDWVSDNASPGFQQIPDNTRFGRLAGKYVADDLYRQITELVETPSTALAIYDKILSWWKTGKTVLNPGTHVRNVLGNLAFSQFAGASVWNPGNWTFYRDSIRHLRNGGALLTEAYDQGVLGGDYVSAELRQNLRTLLPDDGTIQDDESARTIMTGIGKAIGQVLPDWAKNPTHKAYDKIAALYQAEDEVYKLAAYLKAKAMGMNPQEAADHVRKWFPYYDGAGTSGTIKMLGRTAMPFLSFYRESLRIFGHAVKERPLALASALAVPSLITLLSAMLLGLDDDDLDQIKKDMRGKAGKLLGPTPLGGLPIFSMLLPTRSGSGQLQQLDLSAVHPFVDFLGNRVDTDKNEDWWQQTWRSIVSAGPIGNLLYSQMTGRDAFGDRPFVEPNMTGTEKLVARLDNAAKTALPPLTPFVGTGWATVANAGTRSTNKTLEMRDPTQAVLRAIGGIDVRNANPDIYRIADDFRRENGLATNEGMDFGSTTPTSRARKALFGLLAQDNPNPTAVANVLKALDEYGSPVRTPKAIDALLRYKNPLNVIQGRDNQERFRASLTGPERDVIEASLAEYERIKARAPTVIATATLATP